ncbi:hypothetical protein Pyn_08788 [Prunus yedoensis var. nudiflora]|uniref:Uncharacterized protein n=1 Tax=Prunus yedoensis var. nudiflora TaxID=2094558 RepID=A0A314ZFE4_PRUYE|nr:hypothetical protein Pyn_08788 [Prunus yedoensis var. nudiflora]
MIQTQLTPRSLPIHITKVLYPVAEAKRGAGRGRSALSQDCKDVYLCRSKGNIKGLRLPQTGRRIMLATSSRVGVNSPRAYKGVSSFAPPPDYMTKHPYFDMDIPQLG